MKSPLILIAALSSLCSLNAEQANTQAEITRVAAAPQSQHPFLDNPLYPRWSQLKPEQAVIDIRKALESAKLNFQSIASIKPEEATFENVFLALESMNNELTRAYTYLFHLSSVLDSPEVRKAQEILMPELAQYTAMVSNSPELWALVKTVYAQESMKQLSPAKQLYAKEVYDSFKDSGADLPPELQQRKTELDLEIGLLTQKFNQLVLDSENAWSHLITDEKELDGMTQDWKARAAAAAKAKGHESGYLITLDFSSFGTILTDCAVESTRKLCWEAQCGIGYGGEFDTAEIVARVMQIRREVAQILGFKTYADATTKNRMVKTGENAIAFVDDLTQKVKKPFDAENQELLNYVAQRTGKQAGEVKAIKPWDLRYYNKQLSMERFSFDPEVLRPYQECGTVTQGMFDIFAKLFNIRFVELPSVYVAEGDPTTHTEGKVEIWHPSVKVYAVYDAPSNIHLGSFYFDLFSRPTKGSGAWCAQLNAGIPAQDNKPHSPHLANIVCNFPTPTEEHPSLLSHYDVQTLFHEFGHLLHGMLSDVEIRSHSGTKVARDFVELPSQLFEYWTWEPESIALFTKHYQTGEAVPAEIIEKLRASRYFMPANSHMRQMTLAKLDLTMHTEYAKYFEGKDLDAATVELLKDMRIPMTQESPSIMRNLTHCVSAGYAAGYYSYKWAEVLSADAFSRFAKEGILNAKTGADFREAILSKGGSKPADEVYRDFMGRDPNPDALLQESGLIETP